jgi:hypothetical protein
MAATGNRLEPYVVSQPVESAVPESGPYDVGLGNRVRGRPAHAAMKIAGAMAANASSEPLDTHQLDELSSETIEAQGQLDYLRMFLDIEKKDGLDKLERTAGEH